MKIGTLLRMAWTSFRRDRVALSMTFVLPVIFFSIFASVFGNQRNVATRRVPVAVVDDDGSEYSKALVAALSAEGALRVRTTRESEGRGGPLDRAAAEALIRGGDFSVAVVLPKGLGRGPEVLVRHVRHRAARAVAGRRLRSDCAAGRAGAAAESELHRGAGEHGGRRSGDVREIQRPVDARRSVRRSISGWPACARTAAAAPRQRPVVSRAFGLPVDIVNVLQPGGGDAATISFYAAGIGVMFLLFSCAGAGGSLIEEEESGTLGRLIGSRAGMTGVLAGKWTVHRDDGHAPADA